MRNILLFLLFSFCSLFLVSCKNSSIMDYKKTSLKSESIIDTSMVTKDRDINEYIIRAELDPSHRKLSAYEEVSYVNNENVSLDKIYFHLYPNAFRKKDTAPFIFSDFSSAYPQGFSPGYTDIKNISVDNKKISFNLISVDNTILEVILPHTLMPGDKINFLIYFDIKIPPASERFGVLDNIFNLGNWYPIAAVYDTTGWNLDPYYPVGDPFYSDVSNYNVRITVPEEYIIASTGNLKSEKITGNKKTYEFQESSVRDFALCISDKFVLEEKLVDGILLKCYFIKDKNNFAINAAEKSIKSFNRLFGKYPNETYSVVETNFPSGMEYPGIVFIGSKYYKEKSLVSYLEAIIVHETAHQWWYGAVGNDQIDESWLDESLATYSEVIYYFYNYDSAKGKNYYQNYILDNYEKNQIRGNIDKSILKPLSEFNNWNDYGPLVYNKGAMMIHSIRNQLGDEVFFKFLRNYYSNYKFKNASTSDFIDVLENTTNKQWDEFFNKWLN